MHRRSAIAVAIAVVALSSIPSRAAAGPWVPEVGHGYAKLWMKWLYGYGFNDGTQTHTDFGGYNELFLATYGEVGLVHEDEIGLAAVWHTDLLRTFYLRDQRTNELGIHVAPGDPAVGLRLRFLKLDRFRMAFQSMIRAPLASGDEVQPVYSTDPPHEEIGRLRVGTGSWDFPLELSLGYGFDSGFYLAGSGGYMIRSEGYDHVVTWTAEGGMSTSSGFGIRGRFTGFHSIGNGSAPGHLSPSGQGNGTTYVGFAIETDWQFVERWYVGVAFEGGFFLVRRQTGGPVVDLYLATRF